MNINFTSAEKVLFNATVNFAITHEKLSPAEAQERGVNKILQKRALAKKLHHRGLTQ